MKADAVLTPNLVQTTDFWDLSGRSIAAQRAGRYVPDRKDDPGSIKAGRTPPDLCGAIIDTYSKPDDLVADLMAGTGTVLVEAMYRGRNAVGWELEEPRAARAIANVRWAQEHGALGRGMVLIGDARESDQLWDHVRRMQGIREYASLIVIDPPWGETRQDGGKSRFNGILYNYSGEDRIMSRAQRNQQNVGNLRYADYLTAMFEVYKLAHEIALPGAYMAVTIRDYRKAFTRVDLEGGTKSVAIGGGWNYYDKATAYIGQASSQQRRNAAKNGNLVPMTQTVLVFKKKG